MNSNNKTNSKNEKPSIRANFNLILLLSFLVLHLIVLFLLPLTGLNQTWLAGFGLLALLALVTTPMWALAHEAIHGQLHPNKALNQKFGRLLCVFFGSPFRLLRHGHLHHHRHSRMEEDRTEIYDAYNSSYISAAIAFYPRLLGGLYLGEVLANILFLLPRKVLFILLDKVHPAHDGPARARAEKELLEASALRELRQDALMIIALYAVAFYCYGVLWWQLALVLCVRGLLISIVDNSFHYHTPLNDHLYSLNLRLPNWASPLILNFNMHRTHHSHVSLPWHALPSATKYEDEDPNFVDGLLRQLGGPIPLHIAEKWEMPKHFFKK